MSWNTFQEQAKIFDILNEIKHVSLFIYDMTMQAIELEKIIETQICMKKTEQEKESRVTRIWR